MRLWRSSASRMRSAGGWFRSVWVPSGPSAPPAPRSSPRKLVRPAPTSTRRLASSLSMPRSIAWPRWAPVAPLSALSRWTSFGSFGLFLLAATAPRRSRLLRTIGQSTCQRLVARTAVRLAHGVAQLGDQAGVGVVEPLGEAAPLGQHVLRLAHVADVA